MQAFSQLAIFHIVNGYADIAGLAMCLHALDQVGITRAAFASRCF